MAHMRCEYADIEETVEMYNLDVEGVQICLTRETIQSGTLPEHIRTPGGSMHCK